MNQKTRLRQALRASGHRLTRQRQIVLEVLEGSKEHLDAGDVYERVRAMDPRIGMATVYRTLALLKTLGMVREHRLGEEHGHFETAQDGLHYHFTCAICGRVIEFESPEVMEVVQALIDREGVQVEEVHLFVSGCCARCRESGETGI
ncbi:MAG: transcriptional repressor [Anaerolineales bacterium]|nr:transcriptional repressor [Anaerolineales bacterium]